MASREPGMIFHTEITYRGLSALVGDKQHGLRMRFRQLSREAVAAACRHWQERYLPKHFTAKARALYRYPWGDPSYRQKKRRRFGHDLPLVLTGKSRNQILTEKPVPRVKVTADVVRGTCKIRAPWYFSAQKIAGGVSRNRDLLRRTTVAERESFARMIDEHVVRGLNLESTRRSRRVSIRKAA